MDRPPPRSGRAPTARRHALLLLAGVAAATGFGACSAFPAWAKRVSADPLDAGVSLARPGVVDRPVQVVIPERYPVYLVFDRAGHAYEELRPLFPDLGYLHGRPVVGGPRVAVRWAPRPAAGGAPVAGGSAAHLHDGWWSGADVGRRVGETVIAVAPGRYVFRFEVLEPTPALAALRTRVVVGQGVKDSTTWQMGAVFWGALLAPLLGAACVVGAAALLGAWIEQTYHAVRATRRGAASDSP
jgi:hypothetical protein